MNEAQNGKCRGRPSILWRSNGPQWAAMSIWRAARPEEDEAIVAMCLALYNEDPGPDPVHAERVQRTLTVFRDEPVRGRALVATSDARLVGYAFLVSFWSNELGGEICTIDELYVAPDFRQRGLGTMLMTNLMQSDGLWPRTPVALELETTPRNARARALYERLGFKPKRNYTYRFSMPR